MMMSDRRPVIKLVVDQKKKDKDVYKRQKLNFHEKEEGFFEFTAILTSRGGG